MILQRCRQIFKHIIKPFIRTNTNALLLELSKSRLDEKIYQSKKPLIPIDIDLTIVSYNSSKWIKGFFESLRLQTYPTLKINIFIIDNSSTDNTVEIFTECFKEYASNFNSTQIIVRTNLDYGTGHDYAINQGKAKYIFITNIDGKLEYDALEKVISAAENDDLNVASWELRQKPYEHPKYYDPVTLETPWSSHAAVLIRREAYDQVKGFEKKIFMYGEDIELFYRFRSSGYILKYCPSAVIWHYNSVEKPPSAPVYLKDVPIRYSSVKTEALINKPLVSIIMRITGSRPFEQLRCSIMTVANQTYNNIELVIVEDGGSVHKRNCEKLCENLGLKFKYYPVQKLGRAGAGNYGLKHTSGEYLMFLDDDDYLFADHVETIISHIGQSDDYVAGYCLAWEAIVDKKSTLFDCKNLEVPVGLFQEYDFAILQKKNFLPIQSIIFKKQLFLERGGFDESLDYLEDWNLWYRYGYKNQFKFIPKVTSIYTVTHSLKEFIVRNKMMRDAYSGAKAKAEQKIQSNS